MPAFDSSGRVDVERADVPYLRRDGEEFLARVWQPVERVSEQRLCIIDVHGGAWCDNDRRFGKRYNIALASKGAVVVAIDFRCGAGGPHPAGSDDVRSAVRWVRANASTLGIDPARVVLVGSSSGGHLAWLAALAPTSIPDDVSGELFVNGGWENQVASDTRVLGVAALWPPVDPLARYEYASGLDTEHGRRLVANTEAYFGDRSTMERASITKILRSGAARHLPAALLVIPEHDKNVPRAITDDAAVAYQDAGGELQMELYPGVGHAFGHLETEQTDRFDRDLASWLSQLLQ